MESRDFGLDINFALKGLMTVVAVETAFHFPPFVKRQRGSSLCLFTFHLESVGICCASGKIESLGSQDHFYSPLD